MGIRGFYFVWHGAWSDPEIVWHNYAMNMHEVEDPMWEYYAERCKEDNTETTDEGFVQFCKDEVDMMREYAQMAIDCGNAYRVGRVTYDVLLFSHETPRVIAVPA